MILHIVVDDKFIDMAYDMFEKASPNNNRFIVVTNKKRLQYIKTTPINKITLKKFLSKSFAKSLKDYEFVVLHWLDDAKLQFLTNSSKEIKFVWIGWGGDYYRYINTDLLLPKTKLFLNKKKQPLINRIKKLILKYVYLRDIEDVEYSLNKIDFFAPVLSTEFELVAKKFQNFKPKYIEWNYGSIEDNIVGVKDLKIKGNKILIGNSATYENNHVEAFDIFENISLYNREIICPLSYGDEHYKTTIINEGKKRFKNFTPLVEFIELSKYNKIISTCSVVIMNHLRQQALGNITVMMFYGAKIFLNKKNPAYIFYKNLGAVIFSIDELNNESLNIGLTTQEIEKNRKILLDNFNKDTMLKKTKQLIKIVNGTNT